MQLACKATPFILVSEDCYQGSALLPLLSDFFFFLMVKPGTSIILSDLLGSLS